MDIKERLWTIQDAAEYLHVAEKTVQRIVQRGELPAVKLGGQWRFIPEQLSEWLHAKGTRPDSLRDLLRVDPVAVPIDRLLRPERIIHAPDAPDADAVLRTLSAATHAAFPAIDPEDYYAALKERETLASTAIGNGIAVPHIRRIEDNPAGSMDIFMLITPEPIQYGAAWCSVYCLVCTDDIVLHLRIIQKIAYALNRKGLVEAIQSQNDSSATVATILEAERRRHDE